MEELIPALAEAILEIVIEIGADVLSAALENLSEVSNSHAGKTNQKMSISFSDEITKLNLFN